MSQFCLSIALLILLVSMVSCTPWDIHESHDKGYIGHEITFHKPHIRIARLHLKVHHAATKDSACKMKILHHQGNKREHTAASQPAFCRKRFQTGICKARMLRYYYNTNSGRCEVFTYGGCYGNRNKFLTAEECMKNCGGHAGTQGEHGYVTPPNV